MFRHPFRYVYWSIILSVVLFWILGQVPLLWAGAARQYTLEDLGEVLTVGPLSKTDDTLVATRLLASLQRAVVLGALGSFEVPLLPDGVFVVPQGVDGECVVGYASTGRFGLLSHAFQYCTDTGLVDLGTLGDEGLFSAATDINSARIVVGYAEPPWAPGTVLPTTWIDGVPQTSPTLGGARGFFLALNNRGTKVGDADTQSGATHAALWATDGTITDLDTHPDSRFSLAFDVNEDDEAVCTISLSQGERGCRWQASTGLVLLEPVDGDTHSNARANDDLGNVVGQCYRPNPFVAINDHETVCLWGPDGVAVDLQRRLVDDQGCALTQGVGINNAGTIAALAACQGETHAVLLHPGLTDRPRHHPRHPRHPAERVCRDYAQAVERVARQR